MRMRILGFVLIHREWTVLRNSGEYLNSRLPANSISRDDK